MNEEVLNYSTPAGPVFDFIAMGIQTSIWAILFLVGFVDIDILAWLQNLTFINGIILTSFSLMIFYSLGLFVDLMAPEFFEMVCKKSRDAKLKFGRSRTQIIFQIMIKDQYVHSYLTGLTSRLRLAKTTLFNFPIVTISLLLFLCLKEKIGCLAMFFLLCIAFGLWLTIRRYCIKRDVHYHNSVHIAYNTLKGVETE